MKVLRRLALRIALAAGMTSAILIGGQSPAPAALSERHAQWLKEEVGYIISDTEREVFERLPTEELRDQFVEMFWKQRDPTPATAENEYKDEHYRRLAYVNTWFGSRKERDGWQSDRGRIYILFGEPQQKSKFTGENDIRDCEIWFYDSQGVIPTTPFFRLLFYQRTFAHDFVLYSPTHDGPQELAMQIAPTRQQALKYLYERAGREVWEAAQSYIPTAPLGGNWSPESELLLAKIENLHNTMVDGTWAESFEATRGRVSTRLSFRNLELRMVSRTLYNLQKEGFFHAGFEIRPESLQVGDIDGRYFTVFDIRTVVEDLDTGQEVFSSSDHWETRFEKKDDQILARPIAFHQVIPLVPGRYKALWIFDDQITQSFSFRQTEFEVRAPDAAGPFLTPPLIARRYEALDRLKAGEIHPFRIFNIQYSPDIAGSYNKGDDLSVFFQYFFDSSGELPAEIVFDILVGPINPAAGPPVNYRHAVPRDRLSKDGIVFVHRQIPAAEMAQGSYRISVRATEAGKDPMEGPTVNFTHFGEQVLVRSRPDVFRIKTPLMDANYYLERARQAELLGRRSDAVREIENGLQAFPGESTLATRLKALQ